MAADAFKFLSEMIPLSSVQNYKYTAIMVEPRKHRAYEYVLSNFMKNLSVEWQIVLVVGDDNIDYVMDIVNRLTNNLDHRIVVCNINLKNMTNIRDHDALLTDKNFYKLIPTETFLIFQTDSIILTKNKDLIYEFLDEYDFVGAPWSYNKAVGNGGLSLRKKTKMLEIIDRRGTCYDNEDHYFSDPSDVHKPDFEQAKRFGIETTYNNVSFGVHKCWGHLSTEDYAKLSRMYPEIEELRKLYES
jgi:hypothetical protein